uniref:Apple domain-containing protein n=1 Tax=Toxocara canis TaxID=6265 RepID=A0A183UGE7_TOXCA
MNSLLRCFAYAAPTLKRQCGEERCGPYGDAKNTILARNAHMAFGSIGVPPVSDSTDLALFCRLDTQHDRCLRDCGFTVQFNMRDYVCKRHYEEVPQDHKFNCFVEDTRSHRPLPNEIHHIFQI